jgi:hypothetical protein
MAIKIEVIPLIMNVGIMGYYVWLWNEPGKICYWAGAVLVTVGLLFMKG